MKTYRTKRYTTRIKPITQKEINSLRKTQLKKSKSFQQTKFLKSKEFDKQIRRNIKENRVRKNYAALSKIQGTVKNVTAKKTLKSLFSEKSAIRNGKVVKTTSFTSYSQTKKLQKVTKQISQGKFNVNRYLAGNKRYRELKNRLPVGSTTADKLIALDRTNFYFDNRKTILQHNANVQKHGVVRASEMSAGQKLEKSYYEDLNEELSDFAALL